MSKKRPATAPSTQDLLFDKDLFTVHSAVGKTNRYNYWYKHSLVVEGGDGLGK